MDFPSLQLEMPAEIAEAVAKLTPAQQAEFEAAVTAGLQRLLPLVQRTLHQTCVVAAAVAKLTPEQRTALVHDLRTGDRAIASALAF